jgi:hypothetical protein
MSEIAERRNARAASVRSRVLKGSRFNYEQATIAGCVFANPSDVGATVRACEV